MDSLKCYKVFSFYVHVKVYQSILKTRNIVHGTTNCGKMSISTILECHVEVNEIILKTP